MNEPEHRDETSVCPYPYGSGEHLAWELWREFNSEVASYTLGMIELDVTDKNIAEYLETMYRRYGIEVAHYCAVYLKEFETMPPLSQRTRDLMMLARLEEQMRFYDGGVCGNE